MPKNKTVKITFGVEGTVTQEVTITDPKITPAKLRKMLLTGVAATTMQENGTVEIIRSGKVIGKVTYVDNECSYVDFEVTAN
jgi:hypothetical protein